MHIVEVEILSGNTAASFFLRLFFSAADLLVEV